MRRSDLLSLHMRPDGHETASWNHCGIHSSPQRRGYPGCGGVFWIGSHQSVCVSSSRDALRPIIITEEGMEYHL
jgi:hypothetical protein